MIERDGDIFNTDAAYIGHGVNTQGVMGAGIAKEFRSRFYRNYNVYRQACIKGTLTPGGFLVVPERRDDGSLALITNLASQEQPGPDASYKWLLSSLWGWAEQASAPNRLHLYGGRIAIPEIGCGIGGLEWAKVYRVLRVVEYAFPEIEFEVWHYAG